MPTILMTVLKTLGGTLGSMALAMLTGPMLKKLIVLLAEAGLKRYEDSAARSEDKRDDDIAKFLREVLELAKKEWERA